ncbi:hypothetical protein [Amycolatopsis sp. NPDC051071]|uniref:hypothetical protein n=1 Tax=Amycolatopsis sp. NPDC051071 TaxID=3154637 RepID=UPI00342FAD47
MCENRTTLVVIEELRCGALTHPVLRHALELEWIKVHRLDTFEELGCFVNWAEGSASGIEARPVFSLLPNCGR